MQTETLLAKVGQFAQRACGLPRGARVVVGVSGGADSLTLLDALHRLGYTVIAAHYHHGLRAEADADEAAARTLAQALGVPWVRESGDVAALAAARGLSLEAAAREARYRFLFRVAQTYQAEAVAVGHTADDQAETVLMHILRGSGLAGLSGLRARRVIPAWDATRALVRPLLPLRRAETVAYAHAHGLPVRWDASNWDRRFFRNRARLDLLPRLRAENPAVDAALVRLAEAAAADEDFLAAEAARRLPQVLAARGKGYIALARTAFLQAHPALQRRWLREMAATLTGQQPEFAQVELARERAQHPGRGAHPWFGGLRLWVEPQHLWLTTAETALPTEAWPQLPTDDTFFLPAGERLKLADGWVLEASPPQPLPADWRTRASAAAVWLDATQMAFPLTVRPRRPGDVIAPLGLDGRQKISDLMINAKIPQRLRARWPLVISRQRVVWVPLLALAHHARITPQTRVAVQLRISKEVLDGIVSS
ncbi:MAG: tRNA lysidine(34) synthetase TilS [Chloroflexi bacterium]|nr:tRNA lysidine(34) synthetase TilS [Chloroflexota bacterium]